MRKSKFFIETLILSFSIFITKTADFLFRSYISKHLGTEGMGLYQIILTFYSILIVAANMGLSSTLPKIVSEKSALNKQNEVKGFSKFTLKLVCLTSIFIFIFININLNFIIKKIIKEERVLIGIRFLSPCIVFVTLSSCIKGYFYATGRVIKPAISEFLEQFIKIVFISYFINIYKNKGLMELCGAVFLGYTIGELFAFLYLTASYILHVKKIESSKICNKEILLELSRSAFPLGVSAFLSSILHMQEDMMIISSLKRYGMPPSEAISQFGIIDGMIFPLIAFSLTIFSPLVMTLTPEISKLSAIKNHKRTGEIITKVYTTTLFLSIGIAGVFYSFSEEIAKIIYNRVNIGYLLKILSVLCPIMCINLMSGAILNALDQQLDLLKYNILESALRILMIFFLIPIYGIKGFIFMALISEIFMCLLSVNKICKCRSFSLEIKSFVKPVFFCFASVFAVYAYKYFFSLKLGLIIGTVTGILVMFVFYFTQLFICR